MKEVPVSKSFEDKTTGKSASRERTVQVPESMQESLQIFEAAYQADLKAAKTDTEKQALLNGVSRLVKLHRDEIVATAESNCYQEARLEIVGVEDKIGRLADRINRDRKALGKAEWPKEKAIEVARAQLAD